ncbi:MAG: energy transducer TonB [Chloracidobacterium sp.]|nr:energy transducer TonB [Chloracidobacterium sp.]
MTKRAISCGSLFTCFLLSVAITVSVFAQSSEWKEYTSEKGKFSVLLPGYPEEGHRPGPADSGAVISYVINYKEGAKAWSVDYFDLPAIPPDADSVKKLLERRRDSYTNMPKSEKSQILNDYQTLEFKEPIDNLDSVRTVRIILVKQRVYELWVVTQSSQSASEDVMRFFDSFKPVPLTDEEVVEAAKAAIADKENYRLRKLIVSSGVLESRAIKKVQPIYTPEAKAAKVSGIVRIQILVSEEGNVIEAVIVDGPAPLRETALAAARQWVFNPIELAGQPVKVAGILNFNFTLK